MFFSICLLLALSLDKLFGEAERFHPLVGFGNLANALEAKLNRGKQSKIKGIVAVTLLLLPFGMLAAGLEYLTLSEPIAHVALATFLLYTSIGWRSLSEHAQAVISPLRQGKLPEARAKVAMLVSRDTQDLSDVQVSSATTESVLENGADAIFSAIFWFIVGGIPGLIIYRLSNTLDAMWGYKNERYLSFGWAAARLDDLLNYLPARLTAMTYALCGHTRLALNCWANQGRTWKSPNAGPVMASGAGAIKVKLGGTASYHQTPQQRPELGPDKGLPANADSIESALRLINRSMLLLCFLLIGSEAGLLFYQYS